MSEPFFTKRLLDVLKQLSLNSGATLDSVVSDNGTLLSKMSFKSIGIEVHLTIVPYEDNNKMFAVSTFYSRIDISNQNTKNYLGAERVLELSLKPGESWNISTASNLLSLFIEHNKWSRFFKCEELFVLN